MATSKMGYYLVHGELAVVLPNIYQKYKDKPFTVTDAIDNVEGFRSGLILKLKHLNMITRVERKIFETDKTPEWRLTEPACENIKKHLNGELNTRKREKK
jgi:hypothetical protein